MGQSIITVLGHDKPGIISLVTGILYQSGCNLEDISMTILEGELAMILVADIKSPQKEKTKKRLLQAAQKAGLTIFWKDMKKKMTRGKKHKKGSVPHLITVSGKDRNGIVHKTCRVLSDHGLNITDLNSQILGSGPQAVYMMMLEADIPAAFNISKLERSLNALATALKVEVNLKPAEILEI